MSNKLYKWDSEALRLYGSGYIIATGSTLEMARNAVRDKLKVYMEVYMKEEMDFMDDEEIEKVVNKFEEDIAAEPSEMSVIFIHGSE